jgi:hypothetical protein
MTTEDTDAWTGKLQDLLHEAQEAAENNDRNVRREVSQKLTKFIVDSFPDNERIQALDDIAGEAAKALLRMNIDDRIAGIGAGNVELAKLTKKFASAADASNTAQAIRLERVSAVMNVLSQGIDSIRQLETALDAGTDQELIDSLKKADAAIQGARETLQKRSPQ